MRITVNQLKKMIKEELEEVSGGGLEQDLNDAINNLVLESKPRRKKVNESVGVFLGGMLAGVLLGAIKRAAKKIRNKLTAGIEDAVDSEQLIGLRKIEEALMNRVNTDYELTEMIKEYEEGGSKDQKLSKDISNRIADITVEYASQLAREHEVMVYDSKALRQSPQQIRSKMKTGNRFDHLDVY